MKYVASSVTQAASTQNDKEQIVWMSRIHPDKQYETVSHSHADLQFWY